MNKTLTPKQIRKIREDLGLSRSMMAKKAQEYEKCKERTIEMWEMGESPVRKWYSNFLQSLVDSNPKKGHNRDKGERT